MGEIQKDGNKFSIDTDLSTEEIQKYLEIKMDGVKSLPREMSAWNGIITEENFDQLTPEQLRNGKMV